MKIWAGIFGGKIVTFSLVDEGAYGFGKKTHVDDMQTVRLDGEFISLNFERWIIDETFSLA